MERLKRTFFLLTSLALLLSAHGVMAADSQNSDPMRITVSQLKEMLGRPDVVIVDVRDPVSWDKSGSKIEGAVRGDSENLSSWIGKYSSDKTIVLYCA